MANVLMANIEWHRAVITLHIRTFDILNYKFKWINNPKKHVRISWRQEKIF